MLYCSHHDNSFVISAAGRVRTSQTTKRALRALTLTPQKEGWKIEKKKADELKKFIGKKVEILYGGFSYQGVITLVLEKTFFLSVK